MNASRKILLFGALSGLAWSVFPGFLNQLFDSVAGIRMTVVSGIVTGILVATLIGPASLRVGRLLTALLGLLSLPLGAFVFGLVLALLSHIPFFSDANVSGMEAIDSGLNYALLSVVSIFAIGFFPLAVATTFLLRRFLSRQGNPSLIA